MTVFSGGRLFKGWGLSGGLLDTGGVSFKGLVESQPLSSSLLFTLLHDLP